MQMWIKRFMSKCKYSIKIGNKLSECMFPHIGVGQGRRLSPILFNVGCLSMPFWEKLGKSILYADDGCSIISGDSMEELNQKIVLACEDKTDWYLYADFVINGSNSELLGINFQSNSISVARHKMINKSHIKFLDLHITHDLKWNIHLYILCDKARYTANKIKPKDGVFCAGQSPSFQRMDQELISLQCVGFPTVCHKNPNRVFAKSNEFWNQSYLWNIQI